MKKYKITCRNRDLIPKWLNPEKILDKVFWSKDEAKVDLYIFLREFVEDIQKHNSRTLCKITMSDLYNPKLLIGFSITISFEIKVIVKETWAIYKSIWKNGKHKETVLFETADNEYDAKLTTLKNNIHSSASKHIFKDAFDTMNIELKDGDLSDIYYFYTRIPPKQIQ